MNNEENRDKPMPRLRTKEEVAWLHKFLKYELGISTPKEQYDNTVKESLKYQQSGVTLMYTNGPELLSMLEEAALLDDGRPLPQWWEEKGLIYEPSPNSYEYMLHMCEVEGCDPQDEPGKPKLVEEEKRKLVIKRALLLRSDSCSEDAADPEAVDRFWANSTAEDREIYRRMMEMFEAEREEQRRLDEEFEEDSDSENPEK